MCTEFPYSMHNHRENTVRFEVSELYKVQYLFYHGSEFLVQ
jgi:hypothetical protein